MRDLLFQPYYRYSGAFPKGPMSAGIISLASIEVNVPGALVYGFTPGSRTRIRLRNVVEGKASTPVALDRFEIIVVVHGAFLVEDNLVQRRIAFDVEAFNGADDVFPWPLDTSSLEEEGRAHIERLAGSGALTDKLLRKSYPWQNAGVAWALSRPWVLKIWPTGTGKTGGALADAAAVVSRDGGDILIVAPGGARSTWLIQTPQFLLWPAHIMRPESQVRKKDQTFDDYVSECRAASRPAVVIVGMENLADHLDALSLLRPTVLVIDELHKLGSHARWTAINNTDGTTTYVPKRTETGDSVKMSVAAMQVASMPSLRVRIGMTATPLGDGKPRRAWSPLDLLSRGGFGYSYWATFVMRYCGGRPSDFGSGIDDTGQTNSPELRSRLSFIRHQVPYSQTRVGMQPFRVEVVRLPIELQSKPETFDGEPTFNQRAKAAEKEAAEGDGKKEARGRAIEFRLMEAASRKRTWVIDKAVESLQGGGKVVVFTGRKKEVEVWAERIKRKATQGDDKMTLRVLTYSGDHSEAEKIEIERAFREDAGPLLLVATGHSIGESFDGLQYADVAILAMLPWQADQFVQWRGRFDRIGGVPTTLFVVVAVETYDERVVGALAEKFGNIEELFAAEEVAGLGDQMLGADNRQSSLAAMLDLLC